MDPSSLTSADLDPNGNVRVDPASQPTSPQPSDHHSAALPPSRGSSPIPDPSNHGLLNPREHDPPVEDLDLLTESAILEVHRPHLRHKASSSSEKSTKRFLGLRRTSHSPSPGIGSHTPFCEPSPAPSVENLTTGSPEPLNSTSTYSDARPTKSSIPAGQPSLLSTLKARAGDRQALSNTAKETMRKWAGNWGGLKKDRDSSVASSEDAQDSRDSKSRTATQVKLSYAEIRAAVDGRRERERRSSDVSSTPIPIPDRGHKGRADSVSSTPEPRGSSLSSLQAEPSPVPSSNGWSQAAQTSPPESEVSFTKLPAIDLEGTQPDSLDVNGSGPSPIAILSPPTPPSPHPIQSQPSQGKTMTIPGIHARNRGEVMSMGYVPPSPPAPEAKTSVSSAYRFWKHSPTTTQSERTDGGAERASSHSSLVLSTDSAETPSEPSPTNTIRLQAPPLPPRTLHSVPNDSSSLSPASAALKSIVSRDDGCRAKDGEGIEASNASNAPAPVSPKPPLPPRKIQASA